MHIEIDLIEVELLKPVQVADKVFGFTLWKEEVNLSDVWMNYPLHPLQEQEPAGDRQWIEHFPVLQVKELCL